MRTQARPYKGPPLPCYTSALDRSRMIKRGVFSMPLTDQERADFAALASGQISDAMESLGLRRSVVTGLMMLAPPGAKIVGTAVTVRSAEKKADEERDGKLSRHRSEE